eukprot:TRINITY_DN25123_c0_g2_i1.p1 TRINITY_DN25123_c0_g2~~TRINITY_DN25123_c0_g2_i1.p1  ORF type:complete len:2295 (-),score=339.04 TRINITY_DN25123_c0_g2_i1:154-7038(-)
MAVTGPRRGPIDGSSVLSELQPGDRARAEAALVELCAELRAVRAAASTDGSGRQDVGIVSNVAAGATANVQTPAASSRLLSDYVDASPMCAELFELWGGGHDTGEGGRVAVLVLEVLGAVLHGHFERRSARASRTRVGVAGRLLADRFHALTKNLASERDQLLRVTLSVLSGISSQSFALSSQLHRAFNFSSEHLQRLPLRRSYSKKKDDTVDDVRSCYVNFAMSFLRWRDASLTSASLALRGFMGPIVSGLKDDPARRVVAFLADVQGYVLRPRQISRHAKLLFFNAFTLKHFCSLLNSEHPEVVQQSKDTLLEVCTNTFIYRAQQHRMLLDMCLDMKPLREPQQEIVRAILQAHSDIRIMYFARITFNFVPRVADQWFLNVRFLIALLDTETATLAGSVERTLLSQEEASTELRAELLLQAIVPPVVQRSLHTQALLHSDVRVRLAGLRLLSAVLARVGKALTDFHHVAGDAAERLSAGVRRSLPDLGTLLLMWQTLLKECESSSPVREPLAEPDSRAEPEAKRRKKGKTDRKQVAEDAEAIADDAPDSDHGDQVTSDRAAQLLGVSLDDLGPHGAFCEWCSVVSSYCRFLPESLLDVRCDWSKILAVVASPVLTATGSYPSIEAITRLQTCVPCIGAAMNSSGRSRVAQLSKSHSAWIETLLRIRACEIVREYSKPSAMGLLSTCDQVLRECLHPFAAFGVEEAAEIHVWLKQLARHPMSVPLFCRTLHAVASKPGPTTDSFEVFIKNQRLKNNRLTEYIHLRPSLFSFVAVTQLSHNRTRAGFSEKDDVARQANHVAFASLVQDALTSLSSILPGFADNAFRLVESLGPWSDVAEKGTVVTGENVETIRQTLVRRLSEACIVAASEDGHDTRNSSRKRRKLEVHSASGVRTPDETLDLLTRAISNLISEAAAVRLEKVSSFDELYLVLTKSILDKSPLIHCTVFALMDALVACYGNKGESSACAFTWCALMLTEISNSSSLVTSALTIDFVLSHGFWRALLDSVSSRERSPLDDKDNMCLALATFALCRILMACTDAGPVQVCREKVRSMCGNVLLPLCRNASFGLDFSSQLRRIISKESGSDIIGLAWLNDPLDAAAQSFVSLCIRCGMLEDLLARGIVVGDMQLPILGAILGDESKEDHIAPAAALLVQRRAELLRMIVTAVLASSAKSKAESILQKVLQKDRASVLRFSLCAKLDDLWPGRGDGDPFCWSLLPLLAQVCRINVIFRKELVQTLDWSTCDPSSAVRLAAVASPMIRRLPLLQDCQVELASARLVPLPPRKHLLNMLARHGRASFVIPMIRHAAALENDTFWMGDELALMVEHRSDEAALNNAAKCCVDKSEGLKARSPHALLHEADSISAVLRALGSSASITRVVWKSLRSYCEKLSEINLEATSVVLSGMLESLREDSPQQWLVNIANRVFNEDLLLDPPEWLLSHALAWWSHLDRTADGFRKFVAAVRDKYAASLATDDLRRRQVLVADAAEDAVSSTFSCGRDPWEFRRWCGSLPSWAGATPWVWVLDAQRLRVTLDAFWYSRPFHDTLPQQRRRLQTWRGASRRAAPSEADAEAYDVAYVVPFLAGQLRALWAEHGEAGEDGRLIVGPILTTIASGGVLQLLLMATACHDQTIRAAAGEGLAVVLALAGQWNDGLLSHEESGDGKAKVKNPFRELPHFVWLLRAVRSSLDAPISESGVPAALPSLLAAFLAACVPILLQPEHCLYMKVGLFFMSDVSLDLRDFPIFYKLLLGEDSESSQFTRPWMFRVLRRALYHRDVSHATDGLDDEVFDDSTEVDGAFDAETRNALEKRHVLPWLLSFACSDELGTFALWNEAVSCLEAIVGFRGVQVRGQERFALAEWIVSQAARKWTGRGALRQRLHALQSLSRLMQVLLPLASKRTLPGAEQLALGQALKALLQSWIDAVRGTCTDEDRETPTPPFALLWTSVMGFAALVSRSGERRIRGGFACAEGDIAASAEADAQTLQAPSLGIVAELDVVLQRLAKLAALQPSCVGLELEGEALARTIAAASASAEAAFAGALLVLEACPLSRVLSEAGCLLASRLETCSVSTACSSGTICEALTPEAVEDTAESKRLPMAAADGDSGHVLYELLPTTEEAVVRVAASLCATMQNIARAAGDHCTDRGGCGIRVAFGETHGDLASTAARVLGVLVMLPLRPDAAWRAHVLACASLLAIHSCVKADPAENFGFSPREAALAAVLPSPERAALMEELTNPSMRGTEDALEVEQEERLAASSELLGSLLQGAAGHFFFSLWSHTRRRQPLPDSGPLPE